MRRKKMELIKKTFWEKMKKLRNSDRCKIQDNDENEELENIKN
jgi:hypothetical protein